MGKISVINIKSILIFITFWSAFSVTAIAIQLEKAPWVDECYSFYGISHDSLEDFLQSISSGVNFSPPLYFFSNYIAQSFAPSYFSLELLRIESVFWTVLGFTLLLKMTKSLFNMPVALLSCLLVGSQSNLIFEQTLDARHYTMFFACGCWVLYELPRTNATTQLSSKENFLIFGSNLALCLVHYLGIVFSGIVVISLMFLSNKRSFIFKVNGPIFLAWAISIPTYIYLLNQQSSHLNTWDKSNGLSDLLSHYNSSLIPLSVVLIFFLPICFKKTLSTQKLPTISPKEKILLLISVLWAITPIFFWILSHLTSFNLFKSRYFIPSECAYIFIIASLLTRTKFKLFEKINFDKWQNVTVIIVLGFALFIQALKFKRFKFSSTPANNYHHWLLCNEKIVNKNVPIIISGDPIFFPNSLLNYDQTHFWIDDIKQRNIYSKFSKKLKLISSPELNSLKSFILVGDSNVDKHTFNTKFKNSKKSKFHNRLPVFYSHYSKVFKAET